MSGRHFVGEGFERERGCTDSLDAKVSSPSASRPVAAQQAGPVVAEGIEVSALFDDTVMTVRHFEAPRADHRRQRLVTQGLFVGAAIAFLGVGVLFAQCYSQVVTDRAAMEAGVPLARVTAPQGAELARDAAAAGFLFCGLVTLLFALYRASAVGRQDEFTIGSDAQATFHVSAVGLPVLRFPILRANRSGYEAVFSDGMQGDLQTGGKSTSLRDLRETQQARPVADLRGAHAVPLPQGAAMRLQHAGCTFLLRSLAPLHHGAAPPRFEWRTHSYTAGLALAAASLLGFLSALPPQPRSVDMDIAGNDLILRVLIKQPEESQGLAYRLRQALQQRADEGARYDFHDRFDFDFGQAEEDCGSPVIGLGPIANLHRLGGRPACGAPVWAPQSFRAAKPPLWSLGPPRVFGSLDQARVRHIVRQHLNEVKYCYERALAGAPLLPGRLVVKFAILKTGRVVTSLIERPPLPSAQAEQCLNSAIRRWQFSEAPSGITVVTYPFLLGAEDGAKRPKSTSARAAPRASGTGSGKLL